MMLLVGFAFALILSTMVASNSNRIHLICDELCMISSKLDSIVARLERIENKLNKEGK